jgi:DNA-directed RNA polymerase II subunit RPB1
MAEIKEIMAVPN